MTKLALNTSRVFIVYALANSLTVFTIMLFVDSILLRSIFTIIFAAIIGLIYSAILCRRANRNDLLKISEKIDDINNFCESIGTLESKMYLIADDIKELEVGGLYEIGIYYSANTLYIIHEEYGVILVNRSQLATKDEFRKLKLNKIINNLK